MIPLNKFQLKIISHMKKNYKINKNIFLDIICENIFSIDNCIHNSNFITELGGKPKLNEFENILQFDVQLD